MLRHAEMIEIVKQELRHMLDDDRVVSVVERLLRLKRNPLVVRLSREQVVSHEYVLKEDFSQLLAMCIHDLELLEGFESALVSNTERQL